MKDLPSNVVFPQDILSGQKVRFSRPIMSSICLKTQHRTKVKSSPTRTLHEDLMEACRWGDGDFFG